MDFYDKVQLESSINILAKLYDPYDYRGTYRTQVMAYAFIKNALKYRGNKIHIIDHHFNVSQMNAFISDRVRHIVSEYSGEFDIERGNRSYNYYTITFVGVTDPNRIWNHIMKEFYGKIRD